MELKYRFATIREVDIYYRWAIDPVVRKQSFRSEPVEFRQHENWFINKLLSKNCFLYFFTLGNTPFGQVRIEIGEGETIIGISLDEAFRGSAMSSKLLLQATDDFLQIMPGQKIIAYIKTENQVSYKSFLTAGFSYSDIVVIEEVKSYKLIKQR